MTPAAPAPAPLVVVLLLNWRGWNDTIECLESVFRQTHTNLRAVVCDNDSGDDSLERIRAWARGELAAPARVEGTADGDAAPVTKPISCVEYDRATAEKGGDGTGDPAPLVLIRTGGNLGFAGGNNVGIRYAIARGEAAYVWLLNNDTVVDADALRHMVELAEREPSAGMIGSKLMHYDSPEVIQAAAGGTLVRWRGLTHHVAEGEKDAGQWDEVFEPDYITGASLLVKAETIRSIGEMDESYFLYSEEVDWCLRARQRGWRLLYAPRSVVWHKGGQSVGHSSPLHDYHTVRSTLLLVRKFHPRLLPLAFLYSLYRCLAPKVIRMEPARFRAVMQAYRDFFTQERRAGPSGNGASAPAGRAAR